MITHRLSQVLAEAEQLQRQRRNYLFWRTARDVIAIIVILIGLLLWASRWF